MTNVTLGNSTLYCGPGTNYAVAATGVNGKSAEVLWKEGAYYCVRLSSPKVEGFIANRYVTIPTGTNVSSFTPTRDEKYIRLEANAFMGQGVTYNTILGPEKGSLVYALGKTYSTLVYIEYTVSNSIKKYRAWYSKTSMGEGPELTASEYLTKILTNVNPLNEKYNNRDIDGDGKIDTFCNWYAYDAMKQCGTPLPDMDGTTDYPALCRQMAEDLSGDRYRNWESLSFDEAQMRANLGYPTIALEPTHVAVVRPNDGTIPSSKQDVQIAQAGKYQYENVKLSFGWEVGSTEYNNIVFYSWYY